MGEKWDLHKTYKGGRRELLWNHIYREFDEKKDALCCQLKSDNNLCERNVNDSYEKGNLEIHSSDACSCANSHNDYPRRDILFRCIKK